MTLIKRADKGQALTYEEMDGNFTHLGGDGSYQFPATDGLQNQVLVTDGNGQLSFVDQTSSDLKGSVFADDSTLLVDGVDGKIVGPIESDDIRGNFNGSVFADNSTLLVDGVEGKIVGPVENSIVQTDEISAPGATLGTVSQLDIESTLNLRGTAERFTTFDFTPTGVVTHFFSMYGVHRHENLSGDFTPNYIGVPDENSRTYSVALLLEQGATPYMATGIQINSSSQTILWQGGSAPTGTANGVDIVSFTFYQKADGTSDYYVLGSASSYS